VLLDAVCRVFFPAYKHNVDTFIGCVQTLLQVADERMSDAEQLQFIRFYKLPTDRLAHNKLIRLDVLAQVFPRLEMLFLSHLQQQQQDAVGVAGGEDHVTAARTWFPGNDNAATRTPNNTNSNTNSGDNERKARKRRRNELGSEVVVID